MKTDRHYTPVRRRLLLVLMATLLTASCAYKINVQQGNFLDQTKIDQIEEGMTRKQVRYLLGTPSVEDVFHNDRWDYVYQVQYGKTRRIVKRTVTVFFDGDAVTRVEQYGANTTADTNESG